MEIIKGLYAEAKIFTEDIEQYAKAQIQMICDNEMAKGSHIRIMPDVHPGKVGPIGLTMTVGERIIPQLLGVDIGCGMSCIRVKEKRIEFQKLDGVIRGAVPSGFFIRKKEHHMAEEFPLEELYCYRHIHAEKAKLSLGTLGGGNHFIEVNQEQGGSLYITAHTGSRHLGEEVAEYYTKAGAAYWKKEGVEVPYEMTWLEGELMSAYIHDVIIVQQYAELNRKIILKEIIKEMKCKILEEFSVSHNHLEDSNGILMLRKGAISARRDERVIIPINMKEGILLGIGKSNEAWNFSAPHGSGRRIRRDEVRNRHTVSEFKKEMKGIYSSCVGTETLDEAPFAYRSMEQIKEKIQDTVEITAVLKPVYNFKAGSRK